MSASRALAEATSRSIASSCSSRSAVSKSANRSAGKRAASGREQILNVSEAYTRFTGSGPRLGEVGDLCGSRGLPGTCNKGLFCQREPDDNCGRADAPGTCQPRPDVCALIFKPVCGCDGMTYGNACEAHSAEVSVDYEGPC